MDEGKKKITPIGDTTVHANVSGVKTLVIAGGMTAEEVVKADANGDTLQFDFDHFVFLNEEQERLLSHENRINYFMAKKVAQKLLEQEKERDEGLRRPAYEPHISSVADRLDLVRGGELNLTKHFDGRKDTHYSFQPIGLVDKMIEVGYDIVDGSDPVKTPGASDVGGTRRVTRNGRDEMILMKVEKEKFDRHLERIAVESKGQLDAKKKGFRDSAKKFHIEYTDRTRRVPADEV